MNHQTSPSPRRMANNDLHKWTTSDVDFYALLGITFETFSESELRRAYRKTALKYHPDKVGQDFDPDKYELFQAANDVLGDAELKAKYDNHRNAKLQRQRANELFEGKRRQMKEDLEARERGGMSAGLKRGREDVGSDMGSELRKLAEEGRKRRAARQSMMAGNAASAPVSAPREAEPSPAPKQSASFSRAPEAASREPEEEDEVERLERRIREAEAAKAKRKADKKARKSGIFVPAELPEGRAAGEMGATETATPIKRPDVFRGLKADEQSSASPKFSFSPTIATPKRGDFAATMARLKEAEKKRLEEEIRMQESEAT